MRLQEQYAWLSDVKVGDTVVLSGREDRLQEVTNITPTLVRVGSYTFRKRDGLEIGGSTWNRKNIKQPTPEFIANISEREQRQRLANINPYQIDHLTFDQVQRIIVILDEGKA